jgi:pyrroline-5-carboxylate reductase
MMRSVGLLGVGNMGAAILEGLLKKRMVHSSRVLIYDKMTGKAKAFSRKWNVREAISGRKLVESSAIVLLAFKPQDLSSVACDLKGAFHKKPLVVSILAGTPVKKIRKAIGAGPQIVRAMPNLGATVGESVTALCGGSPKSLAVAEKVFLGCGTTVRLNEKMMNLVTAVSGSGPAYFFLLMEILIQECVKQGMTCEQASSLVLQTSLGAARLAQASDEAPDKLRNRVTSKGGTTAAAVEVLERCGVREAFRKAVRAAVRRGQELSGHS